MKPAISVLMPAYNAAATIGVAIRSILNQSFGDFELLVCDDGSSDDTIRVAEGIADSRMRIIRHGTNRGVAATRNTLLREARGAYIAWLDADDIALPGRLERQHAYLEAHTEVDLLFGWIRVRNAAIRQVRYPNDAGLLAAWLLFRNPFAQSTLMARNCFAAEGVYYNEALAYAEDYEWYLRLRHKRFALLPVFLSSYLAPPHGRYPEAMAEQVLLPLLRENFRLFGLAYDYAQRLAFLRFLRSTDAPADCVPVILQDLEKASWPLEAQAGKEAWLALQYFRGLRWASGSLRRRFCWLLLRRGPLAWLKAWQARVRYA
jgi:glycosyltransferase involved in cell wall biosynthesis